MTKFLVSRFLKVHPLLHIPFTYSKMSSSPLPPHNQEQIDRIYAMLSGKDEQSCSLVRFIQIRLRQFQLDSRYQAGDVMGRAYFIAEKKLCEGEDVYELAAWLRRISFNVIRDLKKYETNFERKPLKLVEKGFNASSTPDSTCIEAEIEETQIASLHKALDTLSTQDQDIINSRHIEELSWKDIGFRFNIHTNTARKRGERALDRLRNQFFSIDRPPSEGGES
jgi:RNA polymerase sigma factor (sigma-70 family)